MDKLGFLSYDILKNPCLGRALQCFDVLESLFKAQA